MMKRHRLLTVIAMLDLCMSCAQVREPILPPEPEDFACTCTTGGTELGGVHLYALHWDAYDIPRLKVAEGWAVGIIQARSSREAEQLVVDEICADPSRLYVQPPEPGEDPLGVCPLDCECES